MSGSSDEAPILFGLNQYGRLVHVDDVPNGIACNCACPSPDCAQPLVAKNAGTKVIHHFAHMRGGCQWAVDVLVVRLLADLIRKNGKMAFPALSYWNACTQKRQLIAKGQLVPIASVSLEKLSGRGAPELVVRAGQTRAFVVVVLFAHPLSDEQVDSIAAAGYADIMVLDLRDAMKYESQLMDKHWDRYELLVRYQDPELLESVLLDPRWRHARWERNAQALARKQESRELAAQLAEEKRAREAAEKAEREQKRREEEVRWAKEEAQREAEQQRLAEERNKKLKQERKKRDEELAREIAKEQRRTFLMSRQGQEEIRAQIDALVDQQDTIARDELGRRWCKCELCGKVALEAEFSVMGGKGRLNLGKCRACILGSA